MKKVLIIINLSKDISTTLADEISLFLKSKGFETDFFSFDGFCENISFQNYNFVITLGGDGTVLFAARNCVSSQIPLFPVNLGEFGFIASIQPSEWKECLQNYLDGKEVLASRNMINVSVLRNGKQIFSGLALNDIVLSAKIAANIICLDVLYNNSPLCKLKSDGVIICTPTGSTAYSASAGGPIVDPDLEAFVLTPINAFSLSSRPIVLSANGCLSISIEKSRTKDVSLTLDGQEPLSLATGDSILVTKFEKKVQLVGCHQEKFYSALRSKLNWSGGPHA